VNISGKRGGFCPVDKAQEHNIRDIKVMYRSQGPNIKWDYMKKLHPAIHVIRSVSSFIEKEFGTLARGSKHTSPSAELDIQKLQDSFRKSGFHQEVPGRKAKETEKAIDFSLEGLKVQGGKLLKKWNYGRAYERSLKDDWLDDVPQAAAAAK
jgi:hypothetical protein